MVKEPDLKGIRFFYVETRPWSGRATLRQEKEEEILLEVKRRELFKVGSRS
jgi:hypothetical protein